VNLNFALEIPAYVVTRQVDDQTVILDLSTGDHFGLDFVGARIWELFEGGHSLDHICTKLLTEFAVSRSELERDLLDLTKTLLDRRLVQIAK